MTGRPQLPIGSHGGFTTREIQPGQWRARTYVRDADGRRRLVQRTGASRSAAENAVRRHLTERRKVGMQGELTGASRVADAAVLQMQRWKLAVKRETMAPRSLQAYESTLRLHVLPGLGQLRLREATPARCEAWLARLQTAQGPATVKRARSVLSAVLGLATRTDAIDVNPVRELSAVAGSKTARKPRAVTAEEGARLLEWLDTHVAHDPRKRRRSPGSQQWPAEQVIASRALGDIVRVMIGTGARIGEAMALSWDDVGLDEARVSIRWHIVRVPGEGLQRVAGAKSDAGDRDLRVPGWCVEVLRRRKAEQPDGVYPVFPDALWGWRDPNLIMRWLRWSCDEAGLDWFTSHRLRSTVLTFLNDAGMVDRSVADQAGHAKITQTQDYFARKIASEEAALHLEGIWGGATTLSPQTHTQTSTAADPMDGNPTSQTG